MMSHTLVNRIMGWQLGQFEGADLSGVIAHVEKELEELKADEADPFEWVDLIFLALHALAILGFDADDVNEHLLAKYLVNRQRSWPQAEPGKATEHVR